MKLKVFVLHAGNDVIFETLESVKKNIKIPYELLIWYHPLDDTKKIDLDHFNRLQSFTDDIIMCTKNKKCPAAWGFAQIYTDYDYLLAIADDLSVKENAVDTMLQFHQRMNKVAYVGEGEHTNLIPEGLNYTINTLGNLPDWGGMVSHECINDIGSHGAFFPTYGFDHAEWMERVVVKGYKIVNYKGLFLHGGVNGRNHEGKEQMKGLDESQEDGVMKLKIIERMCFKNYNWWSSKI